MRVAEVRLWGTRIGAVSVEEGSPFCMFKYDPRFIRSGIELSPLMMPLANTIYQFKTLSLGAFKGLPGLLADSLPDRYGDAILNAWLIANGRTIESFNIIDRLCYISTRGMGALEFYPDKYQTHNQVENIEIDQIVELSNQILNQKKSISSKAKDNLKEIIKVGTSAGGARAKAIIAFNERTKEIKSGQVDAGKGFTYWILKLDGVDQKEETSHTKIEYAYYLMAKEAKINMSESRLLLVNNLHHFMTKRFDRTILKDGSMAKIHMQTLGALTHTDYNDPGIMSYEQAAQIFYKLGLSRSQKEQFFRRMVFNVMARNQDDHVKNISFLMDRHGKWSLSPAYDITYAFNPDGKWTNAHQMLINGKRANITKEDLFLSGNSMGVETDRIIEIIDEVTLALSKWETFGKSAFLDKQTINAIKQMFIKH